MILVECSTLFDITETGTTGHCRKDRFPYHDRAGNTIANEGDWNRSRNQQRNLETLHQILSLRTQINEVTHPKRQGKHWVFQFTLEHGEVFGTGEESFSVLENDTRGVPMMTGLGEKTKNSYLEPGKNIWFKWVENSNEEEN